MLGWAGCTGEVRYANLIPRLFRIAFLYLIELETLEREGKYIYSHIFANIAFFTSLAYVFCTVLVNRRSPTTAVIVKRTFADCIL